MAKAQLSLQGIAPLPRAQLLACALAALERHIGAMSAGTKRQGLAKGQLCMLSSAVLTGLRKSHCDVYATVGVFSKGAGGCGVEVFRQGRADDVCRFYVQAGR